MKRFRFNDVNVRSKLVLLHLFISIPVIAISLFFLNESSRRSFDNMRDLSYVSAKQITSNLADQFAQIYDTSERILYDGTLRNYVSTYYEQPYDSYYAYVSSLKSILDVITQFSNNLVIEIYSDNPMLMFTAQTNQSLEDLQKRSWYPAGSASNASGWLADQRKNSEGKIINSAGYYRTMKLPASKSNLPSYTMVLTIMMPEDNLYSMISEEASAGRQIFLYREDGAIITSTDRTRVFGSFFDLGLNAPITTGNTAAEQRLSWQGDEYLAISYPLNDSRIGIHNWTMLYMVPIQDVQSENLALQARSVLLCLLCMALSMLATFSLTKNISSRVNQLSDTIETAWNEKFNIQAQVTGSDEIGRLEFNFNAMIQKIDLLRDEVFQTSLKYHAAELQRNQVLLEKREAEIAALCAQIHPHYLFNTLEAIKMNLLVKHNVDETVEILAIFAENFRFFIDTSTDMVSLREELYFLRNYTAIQKYSYGEMIRYTFLIGEDLLDVQLPKLLLQPLVENALYHGVLPSSGGTITISVRHDDCDVIVCVSDDGAGMDAATLEKITSALASQQPLSEESSRRIALSNISRRLKYMYGDRCRMDIQSAPGQGTRISIRIGSAWKGKE